MAVVRAARAASEKLTSRRRSYCETTRVYSCRPAGTASFVKLCGALLYVPRTTASAAPRGARSSPLACSAETDGATAADGEVRALVCALEFLGERGRAAGSGTTAWQWLSNELGDGARTGERVQVSVEISVDNQAAAPSPLSLLLTPLPAGESAADIAAREGSFFISFYSPICSSFLFFAHQFLVFIYYKYYRAKSVSG